LFFIPWEKICYCEQFFGFCNDLVLVWIEELSEGLALKVLQIADACLREGHFARLA
jgi:hypothetical protein